MKSFLFCFLFLLTFSLPLIDARGSDNQNYFLLFKKDAYAIYKKGQKIKLLHEISKKENKQLFELKVSKYGPFYFEVTSKEAGFFIEIKSLLNKKVILKLPPTKSYLGIHELNICQVGIHKSGSHGGKMMFFTYPERFWSDLGAKTCKKTEYKERKIPLKSHPKYFFEQNFNYFAFYGNGARETINWIGEGSFYDFKSSRYPLFYFLNSSGELFEGNQITKKAKKLFLVDSYALGHGSKSTVFFLLKNTLYQYKNSSKKLLAKDVAAFSLSHGRIHYLSTGKPLRWRILKI